MYVCNIYIYIYICVYLYTQDYVCIRMYIFAAQVKAQLYSKIYVSLAEYRLFYRALLQKRPIILRRYMYLESYLYVCVRICYLQSD